MVWLVTRPHSPGGLAGDLECGDDAFRGVDHGCDRGDAASGLQEAIAVRRAVTVEAPLAAGSSASIRRTMPGNLFAYRPCLDLTIG
jgi:hypothetical protein